MIDESAWLKLAANGKWSEAVEFISVNGWGDLRETDLQDLVTNLATMGDTAERTALHLADLGATDAGCLGAYEHWRWLRQAATGQWDNALREAREQLNWGDCTQEWLRTLINAITPSGQHSAEDGASEAFISLLRGTSSPNTYYHLAKALVSQPPIPSAESVSPPVRKDLTRRPRRKDVRREPAKAAEEALEPQASSSRKGKRPVARPQKDARRTPPSQERDEAKKPARTISSGVRAAIIKLNADRFDKLAQESDGGGSAGLSFGVYHPEEGEPLLRFEFDPPQLTIAFAPSYTGTVSIPTKGTRNPFTALRRRANKEHVRGDVAVTSTDSNFNHTEVEGLLHGTVTKKTVTRRYSSPEKFLTTGVGTPEWRQLRAYAVEHVMHETMDFIAAVNEKKESAAVLYDVFIPRVNIDFPVAEALKKKRTDGTLTHADFTPAVKAIVNLLMGDIRFMARLRQLIGGA